MSKEYKTVTITLDVAELQAWRDKLRESEAPMVTYVGLEHDPREPDRLAMLNEAYDHRGKVACWVANMLDDKLFSYESH